MLTRSQQIDSMNRVGFVHGFVEVDMSDAVDNDLEGWLDLLSDKLIGSPLLMDIYWKLSGLTSGNGLRIFVKGFIDTDDIEEEQQ